MMNQKTETVERTRTFTWEDTAPVVKAAQTMSGLELLQAIVAGKLPAPPIADLMNFELDEVSEGRVVFAVEPAEYHYNPLGVVHGGLAATLCDSAMACAILSTLPAGKSQTTIELHINYTRPITARTGRLRCIGQVINVGRRVATAEARLVDEDNKLYGHGTTTCMILD
jgi:uncharacterized protein (TIGR00369 family)